MNGTSQPIPIDPLTTSRSADTLCHPLSYPADCIHTIDVGQVVCMYVVGYYHTYIVQVRGWRYIEDALGGDERRAEERR